MIPDEQSAAATGAVNTGISKRGVELAIALLLVLGAALVVWDNGRIGSGWGKSGPQAGYFPMRIGILVGFCGLVIGIQALRAGSNELFVSWTQLKRVAQVFIPLTAYVAVINALGIYVASAILIAFFMMFAGRYPWWKAVALAVVANVLMFAVFELQFKVPLPKGPLEAWLGY